jgi:hypothetical protein
MNINNNNDNNNLLSESLHVISNLSEDCINDNDIQYNKGTRDSMLKWLNDRKYYWNLISSKKHLNKSLLIPNIPDINESNNFDTINNDIINDNGYYMISDSGGLVFINTFNNNNQLNTMWSIKNKDQHNKINNRDTLLNKSELSSSQVESNQGTFTNINENNNNNLFDSNIYNNNNNNNNNSNNSQIYQKPLILNNTSIPPPEMDWSYPEILQLSGFEIMSQYIPKIHPNLVSINLPTTVKNTVINPSFCYIDNPGTNYCLLFFIVYYFISIIIYYL